MILDGSLSLAWQFVHAVLENDHFLNTYISQGRVATRLRCGGIFNYHFVMAAVRSRCGHYIFALWFLLSSSSFFFFPRLILAVEGWMSTILPHMVWP